MNDLTHSSRQDMSDTEHLQHFRKLIEKARVGMLTTLDRNQGMRSRPLHTVEVEENGTLWFVISAGSPKAEEVSEHDGKVCLTYANKGDSEYVSVSGHAQLVRDPALKQAFWNKMIDVWFPKGDQDPNVALLKVTPHQAEYWDGPSNTVTQFYAFAKAAVTGKKDAFGENAKLGF